MIKGTSSGRIVFFSLVCFACSAVAAQAQSQDSGWTARIKSGPAPVFSEASTGSRVVTSLEEGETVRVLLEIVSADGRWCSITQDDGPEFAGFIRSSFLEQEGPPIIADWIYVPPPDPAEATAAPEAKKTKGFHASKAEVRKEVEEFFTHRFGRELPISAYGQTRLHDAWRFDHSNSMDVALSPDGIEGKSVLHFLKQNGIPFIPFRHAVPGIASGAHIHIGRPSHRK